IPGRRRACGDPARNRPRHHLGADARPRHPQGAVRTMTERNPASFYWLAILFALFVLFLYGPMIAIVALAFQGPEGGLTVPMNGLSTYWFAKLWSEGLPNVDIWAAFARSVKLGLVVTALTVALSLLAGLAYRKRFRGANALFFVVVASLIMPSIVVSLGIG